jgi:hypothetical protein
MYLRLGMSESSLLLMYYIENYIIGYNKELLTTHRKHILNWLYSTSGFFDITIKGKYFDFDSQYDNIIYSKTYRNYFYNLLEFIRTNQFTEFYFKAHNLGKPLNMYIPTFYQYIGKKQSEYVTRNILYKELNGKRVLLMHNLSELMIQQYNSGIVKRIYAKFPRVELFIPFKIGYTFMNRPMNNCNNIIERADLIEYTLDHYIETNNINFVIISCGAYSNIFAQKLHAKGISYATIGGELEHEFGIITNRHKTHPEINHLFIKVPDELKPENHKEIEDSCYW